MFFTFNHDFIGENISWNTGVKSILLVDKVKIEEHEKLKELKRQQKRDIKTCEREANIIKELEGEISKFYIDAAHIMKRSLHSLFTKNNYYLNYDQRRFETVIKNNLDVTKIDTSLLDDKNIKRLIIAANSNQKPLIKFIKQTINQEIFTQEKQRLDDLLKISVVNKIIKRLVEHSDIRGWVETGLNLHKNSDTNRCELCGNPITEERIKELEAYFTDDYKDLQSRLKEADKRLLALYQPPLLPEESEFYEEFKKEYQGACKALDKAIGALNKEISAWRTVLKEKIDDPFKTEVIVEAITESTLKDFNDAMRAISTAVGKHNHKSKNFEEVTGKAMKPIEFYVATMIAGFFNYHDKKKEVG